VTRQPGVFHPDLYRITEDHGLVKLSCMDVNALSYRGCLHPRVRSKKRAELAVGLDEVAFDNRAHVCLYIALHVFYLVFDFLSVG
jgi:hypothetical protein